MRAEKSFTSPQEIHGLHGGLGVSGSGELIAPPSSVSQPFSNGQIPDDISFPVVLTRLAIKSLELPAGCPQEEVAILKQAVVHGIACCWL